MTDAAKIQVAAAYYTDFMRVLGLPLNEDTEETPARVARMFVNDFCSHNGAPPRVAKFHRKNYDQYVVVRGITFSSLCEHHHLPFSGLVHIGYHPKEWLAGLSKFSRVVKYYAGRPQIQEHLVVQIAEYLFQELQPHVVMVVAEADHTCMRCRGVKDPTARTITSKIIRAPYLQESFGKDEMLRLMGY